MRVFPECPVQIREQTTYFCHLLNVTRSGKEEQICSLCAGFRENCEKFPRLKYVAGYAAQAHRGQIRKGTKIPYWIHLLRTWHYVQQMTNDQEEWEAAFLHDTLEDTAITLPELQRDFGVRVAQLVFFESEEKRKERPAHETWELRKKETILHLRDSVGKKEQIPAMHIAFGDKIANLCSMVYEYRRTGDLLWNKFNQTDPKKQGWYYGELGCLFEQNFNRELPDLVEEYRKYYEEVFGSYEISDGE